MTEIKVARGLVLSALLITMIIGCSDKPGANVATKIPVQSKAKQQAKINQQTADAFLKENASRTGVTTTASGLQYEVLKQGDGKTPGMQDTVATHYIGKLIDGTEFDNSYKRGEPLTIPVGRVIPGWTEALQMMKEGDKWRLFIPPALGYGERGAGPIPPNSLLIFDVELVEVK